MASLPRPVRPGNPARGARWSLAVLLAANIVAAMLALRDDRGYQLLLFAFGAEILVIAVLNLPKMLVVVAVRGRRPASLSSAAVGALGLWLGVAAYAGMLGALLLMAFIGTGLLASFVLHDGPGSLLALPAGRDLTGDTAWAAVVVLGACHLYVFGADFLARRTYRRASLALLALEPLLRAGLLLMLVGAGALIGLAGSQVSSPTAFTVLLVALKIGAEVIAWLAAQHSAAVIVPPVAGGATFRGGR